MLSVLWAKGSALVVRTVPRICYIDRPWLSDTGPGLWRSPATNPERIIYWEREIERVVYRSTWSHDLVIIF